MRRITSMLLAATTWCLAMAQSPGAAIPGIYSTGVDNAGIPLADGATDLHYQFASNPDSAAVEPLVQNAGFPIAPAGPWVANTASAKWIGPRADTSGAAGGGYTYRLNFDLTGLDPASAVISGRWATDNAGQGLYLNGVYQGFASGGFGGYTDILINAGFLPGLNTLEFVVSNDGAGYTGMQVELRGTAQTFGTPPEVLVNPAGFCLSPGLDGRLSVTASGTPPLTYQWRRNGVNLGGQVSDVALLPAISAADAGNYDVIVGNASGSVTSQVAVVIVGVPVNNPSFEADTFSVSPGYVAGNGPITGWNALGGHGINPGVGFSPFADQGAIPNGTKVAFLQQDGSLSQVISAFTPGTQYAVQYFENSRNCCGGTIPAVSVRVGGTVVVPPHLVPPVGGLNPYRRVLSEVFEAASEDLEFAFTKSNPQGGDTTALVDNLCIFEVPANTPPSILTPPQGGTVSVGQTATFSVRVFGSLPLQYQWMRNGEVIPGQTGPTLVIENAQEPAEGDYTVSISNGGGSVTSTPVTLEVWEPIPGLYNTGVDNGGAPLADGAPDPHYELIVNPDGTGLVPAVHLPGFPIQAGVWLLNTPQSKWIAPRPGTAGSAGGDYTYRLTFDLGDRDPNTVVIMGRWATDNAGVNILVNGVPTGLANTAQFASWTTFTLSSQNQTFFGGVNTIDFVVNNSTVGYTALRVEFLASNGSLPPGVPPTVTVPPASRKAAETDTVSFSVQASGSSPLTFQWNRDGVAIPGATSPTLVLPNVVASDSGVYTCTVDNEFGSATSDPANLCVCWSVLPNVFGTGVDAAGQPLADGEIDVHYEITSSPDPGAAGPASYVVNAGFPIPPWVANSATSKWIGPSATQGTGNAQGDYTYETIIDLTGVDPSQVRVEGRWAVDNLGRDILVNGTGTGITSPGFGDFTPFTITSGLQDELNSLAFVVNNAPSTPNPTGLRVDLRALVNIQPRLQVAPGPLGVTVSWTSGNPCQRLFSADHVTGPWTAVPGGSNPVIVPTTGPARFFRVVSE